jgi:hypothetical protein
MTNNLNFSYDASTDILIIEGVPYSGDYFRTLAKVGADETAVLKVRRDAFGKLSFQRIEGAF